MKILITGSSGMVGKELKKVLARHDIIEFDHHLKLDILNEEQLKKKMAGVNCVIHLAGIIDTTNPNLWEVNVNGTKKVLQSAINAKVKKFIFMSSTGVYGTNNKLIDEKTPIHPENEYEKSKAEGEKIVFEEREKIGVNVIRSAIVLGTNDYWKKMFKMLQKKYPLPLNGENHFQVIYSKELACAIKLVMEKGITGEIYLAAGNEKKTLNEFCNLVQSELGLEKKLVHIPSILGIVFGKLFGIKLLTIDNIRHLGKERNYNTKKIHSIGYKQKYSLKEALNEIVKEFNKTNAKKE